MPRKPVIVDTFCCAGGAGRGYDLAKWDVVGVDQEDQPNYPYRFIRADAIEFLSRYGGDFDARHASPPCHDHSPLSALSGADGTGSLLAETYAVLTEIGGPWVIENVVGAKLPEAGDPTILCGSMFYLGAVCADGQYRQLRRHRKFWSNVDLSPAPSCRHVGQPVGVYGTGGGGQMTRGYKGNREDSVAALETPWMSRAEVSQAIPPAYTEWVGQRLRAHIKVADEAA